MTLIKIQRIAVSPPHLDEPRERFTTAMDDKVCTLCEDYEEEVFAEDDPNKPEIPLHPNCRCEWEVAYSEAIGKNIYKFKKNGKRKKESVFMRVMKEANVAHDPKGKFTSLNDVATQFKSAGHILQSRHGNGKVLVHRRQTKIGDAITVKHKNADTGETNSQIHTMVPPQPQPSDSSISTS